MMNQNTMTRIGAPKESTRRFIALSLTVLFLVSSIPSILLAESEIEIRKEENMERGTEVPPPAVEETDRSEETERREVRVERRIGNPMAELFKNTFFGALTGVLVGGILVAIDNEDASRKLSTSAAVGAGVGLLYGAYVITSLEQQTAALEWENERFALNVPDVNVRVLSVEKPETQEIAVGTSLLKIRF